MADEDFSPETQRFAAPRYFDNFRLGERFYIPSRTMTEALFAAFQLASGSSRAARPRSWRCASPSTTRTRSL